MIVKPVKYFPHEMEEQKGSLVTAAAKKLGNGVGSVFGYVGQGAKWVAKSAANTTWDAAKYSAKKTFNKALDATIDAAGWVAKKTFIAYLGVTALTAVGAAISPETTAKIVDKVACSLGATPRAMEGIQGWGDTMVIQAEYTGELLALAIKKGVTLSAKMVYYTLETGYTHVFKPLVWGFASTVGREAGNAWHGAKSYFWG
jgi:hypothetical protein